MSLRYEFVENAPKGGPPSRSQAPYPTEPAQYNRTHRGGKPSPALSTQENLSQFEPLLSPKWQYSDGNSAPRGAEPNFSANDDFYFGGPHTDPFEPPRSGEPFEYRGNTYQGAGAQNNALGPGKLEPFLISEPYDNNEPDINGNIFQNDELSPFSGPFSKDHINHRLRQNERNRQQQAARLPYYHYTKLPFFSIIVTIVQIIVFIVELVRMGILTGSPFQTQPYFNPMLGPSTYLLVNMGARYVPCMNAIVGVTLDMSILFPCPNSTTVETNVCNLSQLCGMGGIPVVNNAFAPDQNVRVFTAIFLHAGFLHILFNLMLQLSMCIAVERHIGFIKCAIIYVCSGVAGFLLGANFSPNGIAASGASGSLFGIIAPNLLLFIYCGRKNTNIYFTKKYTLFIIIMVIEIIVSFVLGLLPGLDNFSHIGGFCMGLLLSVVLLQDPSFVYQDGIYTYDPSPTTWQMFAENWNPLNKLHDKVRWKMALWAVLRAVCAALVILYFVLLTRNLYSLSIDGNKVRCSWCKYINCIPVNGWCEMGEVTVSMQNKRSNVFEAPDYGVGASMGDPHFERHPVLRTVVLGLIMALLSYTAMRRNGNARKLA